MLGTVDTGCNPGDPTDRERYENFACWYLDIADNYAPIERSKVRKAMEAMLLKAAMKIVTTVNREKDHIPPITTSEANPFPYQIVINPKGDGWGARMGIF